MTYVRPHIYINKQISPIFNCILRVSCSLHSLAKHPIRLQNQFFPLHSPGPSIAIRNTLFMFFMPLMMLWEFVMPMSTLDTPQDSSKTCSTLFLYTLASPCMLQDEVQQLWCIILHYLHKCHQLSVNFSEAIAQKREQTSCYCKFLVTGSIHSPSICRNVDHTVPNDWPYPMTIKSSNHTILNSHIF